MKTIGGVKILVITGLMFFYACEKTGEPDIQSIEGTYIGKLVQESGLKGISAVDNDAGDAFAEVTMVEDGLIEVYCHGDHLDTTFMLNYYEHDDSDEHFGGFNMDEGMFTYTFRMMNQSDLYHLTFQGTKE